MRTAAGDGFEVSVMRCLSYDEVNTNSLTFVNTVDFVICLKLFHIFSQIATCILFMVLVSVLVSTSSQDLCFETKTKTKTLSTGLETKTETLATGLEIKTKTLTKRTRVLSRTKTLASRSQD